jgi:hypothetical protein
MTFSFGNEIVANVFRGNAICGIWGGYSQRMWMRSNEFDGNGDAGYGLERGGVNIEHGFENRIENNTFHGNKCGVHLWWADNKDFPKKPWGTANYRGCVDNVIAGNSFDHDTVAIHLRSAQKTTVFDNTMKAVPREIEADVGSTIVREKPPRPGVESSVPDEVTRPASRGPIGARDRLAGREKIIMTEWGPWDHESPLVRLVASKGAERTYELRELVKPSVIKVEGGVTAKLDLESHPPAVHIVAKDAGVTPYRFTVTHNPEGRAEAFPVAGTIVSAKWNVRFFPTSAKPHENPEAWARDSKRTDLTAQLDALDLRFGIGGPVEVLEALGVKNVHASIGPDNFGLVAETSIPLRKGKWRISTLSDDGIRVTADGKKIIDRWNWHAPTKDTAILDLPEDKTVPIRVEYFELDGFAVLTLAIEEVAEGK